MAGITLILNYKQHSVVTEKKKKALPYSVYAYH